MVTLTLVAPTLRPRASAPYAPPDAPLPTMEFLQRMLRALPVGERTLGAVLDETIAVFEQPELASVKRSSALSDQLRAVGIWLCHPTEDEDPPLFAQVVYPAKLANAYPALSRHSAQLSGLALQRAESLRCP